MTTPVENAAATESVTVTVADHANGGKSVQVTVPVGTLAEDILREAGISVKEGQRINFAGNQVGADFEVGARGLLSVTKNTKAANI